jgi:pyruvate dehydrogenase phosphatase
MYPQRPSTWCHCCNARWAIGPLSCSSLALIFPEPAIGDHLFKLPTIYTERVFLNAKAGFQISNKISDFIDRNLTPPYISSQADVRHTEITFDEGYLILCTDGLLDLCEGSDLDLDQTADGWVQLVAKRGQLEGNGPHVGPNLALCILRDALGGDDHEKVSRQMTVEMTGRWMDDTTILVQNLGRGGNL